MQILQNIYFYKNLNINISLNIKFYYCQLELYYIKSIDRKKAIYKFEEFDSILFKNIFIGNKLKLFR